MGGDNITFTGNNFPHELLKSQVNITFGNTKKTLCVPSWSNETQIICETDEFDETTDAGLTNMNIEVKINNKVATHNIQFKTNGEQRKGMSMTPMSVSPVLKTNITIQLESTFPYTLNRDDFTVNATNMTNKGYKRYLRVIDVDDATKTLICKFGGAWSGKYKISIRHITYGRIKSGLILDVSTTVT